MKLISYRGNITGAKPHLENTVPYVNDAIAEGYIVLVDVWLNGNKLYIGNSPPQITSTSRSRGYKTGHQLHEIDEAYLENHMILVRARTASTLSRLARNGRIHCFFANKHSAVTSQGFLWTTEKVKGFNVIRMNLAGSSVTDCYAVCSNNIRKYGRPDASKASFISEKLVQIREEMDKREYLEQKVAEIETFSKEARRELLLELEGDLLEEFQRRIDSVSELVGKK
tara:strand:- start:2870 stop:3547 length:678 start_codon:yes stop_codon:yes gene_type:complete